VALDVLKKKDKKLLFDALARCISNNLVHALTTEKAHAIWNEASDERKRLISEAGLFVKISERSPSC
jgi:hypothetical protein